MAQTNKSSGRVRLVTRCEGAGALLRRLREVPAAAGTALLGREEVPREEARYLLLHGTSAVQAALMEQRGWVPAGEGALGSGVYLTRDLRKATQYACAGTSLGGSRVHDGVVLAVVARLGRVCQISEHPPEVWRPRAGGHEAPWHEEHGFDSAWVDPACSPASAILQGPHAQRALATEYCLASGAMVERVGERVKWDTRDPEVAQFEWLFKEDAGRAEAHCLEEGAEEWVAFSRQNSLYLEAHCQAFRRHGGRPWAEVRVEPERKLFGDASACDYRVDLRLMEQQNKASGRKRLVRRQPLAAKHAPRPAPDQPRRRAACCRCSVS
eukprot:1848159-Rhodomonas_salina.1